MYAQFVGSDFVYISPVFWTSFSLIIAMHMVRAYLFLNISVTNLSASFYGLVVRVLGPKHVETRTASPGLLQKTKKAATLTMC